MVPPSARIHFCKVNSCKQGARSAPPEGPSPGAALAVPGAETRSASVPREPLWTWLGGGRFWSGFYSFFPQLLFFFVRNFASHGDPVLSCRLHPLRGVLAVMALRARRVGSPGAFFFFFFS